MILDDLHFSELCKVYFIMPERSLEKHREWTTGFFARCVDRQNIRGRAVLRFQAMQTGGPVKLTKVELRSPFWVDESTGDRFCLFNLKMNILFSNEGQE